MSLADARTTLKVLGILNIVLGIFGVITGIGLFAGGHMLGAEVFTSANAGAEGAEAAAVTGLVLIMGIFVLVAGIVYLLEGICSLRAAGDPSKVGPAYILAILGVVASVITLVLNIMNGITVSNVVSGLLGVGFSVFVYRAAATIKNYA